MASHEKIREAALNDFKFCFECVFYPGLQLANFHQENFQSWLWGEANLLLGYPGSAKSTARHVAYHAWLLLRNRWELKNGMTDKPLLTASGSQNVTKATNFTRAMKRLLALPIVTALFGLCVDMNSSDEAFNLLGIDYSREKDFAVQAFGAESGELASIHSDIITLDDPITIENARSAVQREKFSEKVPLDIERALRRPTFTIFGRRREPQFNVIGYPHHTADFYAELQDFDRHPKFKGRIERWPILLDDGTPLWQEQYPRERCQVIKVNTPPHLWLGMYLQKGASAGGDAIRDTWLRWSADFPEPSRLGVYIGVDLAIKQTEHSDYSAFFAVGIDYKTRTRWELKQQFGRWTFDERCQKLKEFCEEYKNSFTRYLVKVAIETHASGSDVLQTLRAQTDLNVVEVKTVKDKLFRLTAKSHLFEQGKFILKGPARNDFMPGVGDFVAELLSFRHDIAPPPPAHDDRTDAMLLAEAAIGDEPLSVSVGLQGQRELTPRSLERF